MAELDENKKIEEHIRSVLKDFTVSITEDQKNFLFQKYDQIKTHHKNIQFHLPEIIKNKTLWIISGAFVLIILLIYIVTLYSSPSNDKTSSQSISPSVDTTNNQSISHPIDTIKHTPSHRDTITSTSKTNTISITTPSQTNITSLTNNNKELNKITDDQNTNNSKKLDTTTIPQKSNTSNDIVPKKKRKKRTQESNVEDQNLPVLEPKTPELNTKEEE
jgi:preprotein translocase subunit SecF